MSLDSRKIFLLRQQVRISAAIGEAASRQAADHHATPHFLHSRSNPSH
jgi:hypothetical protein